MRQPVSESFQSADTGHADDRSNILINMGRNRCAAVSIVGVTLLALSTMSTAAPNDLDPMFGTTGSVTISAMPQERFVRPVRDGQDRLYVGVSSDFQPLPGAPAGDPDPVTLDVRRFDKDGQPDLDFGMGGILTLPFPINELITGLYADHVARQLLVSSVRTSVEWVGGDLVVFQRTVLTRVGFDGVPDPAFGTAGTITLPDGGTFFGTQLLLEPDGDILVAGPRVLVILGMGVSGQIGPCLDCETPPVDIRVIRLKPDGSPDLTFGMDGQYVLTREASGQDQHFLNHLVQDEAGNTLLCGSASTDLSGPLPLHLAPDSLLVRLTSDGRPDQSFGNQGVVLHDFGRIDSCEAVSPRDDGGIGLASIAFPQLHIARLRGDGSLDTTFDMDGIQTTELSVDASNSPLSLIAQSDGRLVLEQTRFDIEGAPSTPELVLTRLEGSPELAEPMPNRNGGGGLGLCFLGVIGLAAFLRRAHSLD